MPMGNWITDTNPTQPDVYCTRSDGDVFDYWRYWTGLWWSIGYWTRAGCQQAVADFQAEDARMPRASKRVKRWRAVLP